jgi:anti-sigma-K factor RskA
MSGAATSEQRKSGGRRSEDNFALELIVGRLEALDRRLDRAVEKLEDRFDRALIRFESRIDELQDLFGEKVGELEDFHLEDQAETKTRVAIKTEQLSRWQKWAAAGAVLAVAVGVTNFVLALTHHHP